MENIEDLVSKVSQEISSEMSIYKMDVNYKIQDLQDEQVREKISEIFEIHHRFMESVMDKVLGLINDLTS